MTIDERLERLTERHEALTGTVELMAAENRAGFARLERVENMVAQMAQSIDTLARVVELPGAPGLDFETWESTDANTRKN